MALGSNVAPERNLPEAVRRLAELVVLRRVSSAWATPPVGPSGQPPFLNAAALVVTELDPGDLKARVLREVERALGRVRTADRFAPRPIDIDLVLWAPRLGSREDRGEAEGGEDAGERARVLDADLEREPHLAVPAAELLPGWTHPATGEPLERLAARLLASLPSHRHPRRTSLALGGRFGS